MRLTDEPVTGEQSPAEVSPGFAARQDAESEIAGVARFPSENPFPVLRVSPEGLLLYANAVSRVVLVSWGVGVHQFVPATWRRTIAEALRTNTMCQVETRCGNQDISFAVVPVLEEGYVNLYGRDVTDQKRARQALLLLSEASAALAESLDFETTLATLAQAVVPGLADWCVVSSLEDAGKGACRAAVAYADAARAQAARRLKRLFEFNPQSLWHTARGGRSQLFAAITDGELATLAGDAERLQFLRGLAPISAMVVPLRARGQDHGALYILSTASGRHYDRDDLALTEELARRAAIVVDNALLYAAEQQARRAAERANERTVRLQALTSALSGALTPAQVVDAILAQGTAATGACAGVVVRVMQPDCALEILGTSGYADKQVTPWQRFPLSAPVPLAEAVRCGAPVLLGSPAERQAQFPELTASTASTNAAMAAIPLVIAGKCIGAMGLSFTDEHDFSAEETTFMLALAHQCAQALDRSQLFEATREAVRARERFLAAASHELRTPVTVIWGYLQGLQRQLDRASAAPGGKDMVAFDRERLAALVHRSERAVRRLTALVEELLDTGRYLQRRPLTLYPELVDLTAVLQSAAWRIQLAQSAGQVPASVKLQLHVPDKHVWGEWDRGRIEQVVTDLLDNALRFSPVGGLIQVRLESEPEHAGKSGTWAHVTVHDQGIGLPPGEHARIFDLFVRASNVSESNYPGLGVGLAIAKEIVEQHGGAVWAESPGVNQGSTFHLVLPSKPPRE